MLLLRRYTPFSERQQLGSIRSLNCAGTACSSECPDEGVDSACDGVVS